MTARRIGWVVLTLFVLVVAVAVWRALAERQARQASVAVGASAQNAATLPGNATVELAETDVVIAGQREMVQGLPISGTLRAVNSAMVKARVAGELRGLTVREGDFVRAGQVIGRIEGSDVQARVRQASEQASASRAQVEVAQRQYDNNKALVAQGFISATALDASLANLNAAQATFRAATASTDIARQLVLDAVLTSPIAGQVAQRFAQAGERVGLDARIVEIVDLRALEVEATLNAAESLAVQVGQSAELQVEGGGATVSASVVRISPSAQGGSRSVLAYLRVNPSSGSTGSAPPALRQGLFVQGTLNTLRTPQRVVPVSAVRVDKPAPYLQVIENGTIAHRPAVLGQRGTAGGEAVVVVADVAESAVVVRGQIGPLREGTRVVFTRMATPQAATGAAPAPAPAPAASAPARPAP
jgi:membrane fusion protein, multidrug efflux system